MTPAAKAAPAYTRTFCTWNAEPELALAVASAEVVEEDADEAVESVDEDVPDGAAALAVESLPEDPEDPDDPDEPDDPEPELVPDEEPDDEDDEEEVLFEAGARFVGAAAASLAKLARERVAFAFVLVCVSICGSPPITQWDTYFSFTTKTIPASQCFP
jgi:hypothetical protein